MGYGQGNNTDNASQNQQSGSTGEQRINELARQLYNTIEEYNTKKDGATKEELAPIIERGRNIAAQMRAIEGQDGNPGPIETATRNAFELRRTGAGTQEQINGLLRRAGLHNLIPGETARLTAEKAGIDAEIQRLEREVDITSGGTPREDAYLRLKEELENKLRDSNIARVRSTAKVDNLQPGTMLARSQDSYIRFMGKRVEDLQRELPPEE